jgi:hypothetical protein
LLEATYSRPDAPRICSIWNEPGKTSANLWDTHRSIAAFHVYVHLSLLCSIAEQAAPEFASRFGPIDQSYPMTARQKCVERAGYLGENLKSVVWNDLGAAGKAMVEWLLLVLDCLSPNAPRGGAYLSLLLDRYRREADNVFNSFGERKDGASISLPNNQSDVPRHLEDIIQHEVETASRVMELVGQHDNIAAFHSNLKLSAKEPLANRFYWVRHLISDTLSGLSVGANRIAASESLRQSVDRMVREMIDEASQKLAGVTPH